MFTKISATKKIVVLIVYIDDIILTSSDVEEIIQLKKNLSLEFEIKDLRQLRYFLRWILAGQKEE